MLPSALCAGEVSFYYRDKASQGMQHISEFKAPCTVLALWAPCGSYFATASTYPRMKVDNCLSVLDYRGKILSAAGAAYRVVAVSCIWWRRFFGLSSFCS